MSALLSSKVIITAIISKHYSTFKDESSKATSKIASADLITFLVAPLLVSTLTVYNNVVLTPSLVTTFLATFAILTAFLLHLLVFVFELIGRKPMKTSDISQLARNKRRIQLLQETYYNISYASLVGILISIVLVFGMIEQQLILRISTYIVFSLTLHFILTLFMILKRLHSLLEIELSKANN